MKLTKKKKVCLVAPNKKEIAFFHNKIRIVLDFMMELHQLCLTLNAFQQSMSMCWVEDRFLDQEEG
jgi:hypothetical protein